MASPRPTATRRSLRTSSLARVAAAGLAAAAALAVLPAGTVAAEPRPSLAEVERQVAALNAKADSAVEQYAETKLELAVAARRNAVAQRRVRATEAALDRIRTSMSAVASAAYKAGGTDQLVQLVSTSTPQTFLDRAASLNRIAAGQSAQLNAAAVARHRLETARRAAADQQAAQESVARSMARDKAAIEAVLAEQEQLLGSLRADERARLAAIRAAADRQAALEAAREAAAARLTAPRPSRARPARVDAPSYTGPASGRAAIAVREAYRKLGRPYKWAAAGPDRFDCSGLTMWVWGKAGVSLPHSSRAQYAGGRKVSRSEVQPGDLVFAGSPIHHVGIYVGGGKMISAPQTGDVVKVANAFRRDYAGAIRP